MNNKKGLIVVVFLSLLLWNFIIFMNYKSGTQKLNDILPADTVYIISQEFEKQIGTDDLITINRLLGEIFRKNRSMVERVGDSINDWNQIKLKLLSHNIEHEIIIQYSLKSYKIVLVAGLQSVTILSDIALPEDKFDEIINSFNEIVEKYQL